jgi:cyanophycin synthetase
VAIAERTPAHVIGDGRKHNRAIDRASQTKTRDAVTDTKKVLTQIEVDRSTEKLLKAKNYTLQTVLPKDERLILKTTANISTGGTAIDRTG